MISLEQIRLLEAKITKAVELIKSLKAENASLRNTLDSTQSRMQELEKLVGDLKTDQREIEASILRAIENLDRLEDEVSDASAEPGTDAGETEPAGELDEPSLQAEAPEAGEEQDSPEDELSGSDRELDIF